MSDGFKDRLKRLHDAHRRGKNPDGGPSGVYTGDTDDGADSGQPPEATGYGWERLGAEKLTDYSRPLWIARQRCDENREHGDWTIGDCRDVSHRLLANLGDDVPDDTRRRHRLYMDTETTGLGDDAIVFMLGIGYWSDDNFFVEQFLLDEEDDEPALLEAFSEHLAERQLLVTFNGRRFDVPLLQRRYAEHGIDDPFDDFHHLDLLPLARRAFPGLNQYRLTNLERQILAFERIDDVPGRDIPRRWWKYQRSRDAELMRNVLEHNLHDVISMEALVVAAIAGESPKKDRAETETKWSFGRLGFKSHLPAPKTPMTGEPDEPAADDIEPKSSIGERLARTYRLRGKFADRDRRRDASPPETIADKPPNVEPPPANVEGPDTTDAVALRATELRRTARRLVDQEMWPQAFPLLCELVALVPDDDRGLQMLVRYYRREGNTKLARRLEQRRANSS